MTGTSQKAVTVSRELYNVRVEWTVVSVLQSLSRCVLRWGEEKKR